MSFNPEVVRPSPLSFEVFDVTPATAAKWLERNVNNYRPLRPVTVSAYASDMARGRWQTNPADPVCFAADGSLLNGQHRLSAIVESGATVSLAVVTNVDAEVAGVMDGGRKRAAHDHLRRMGVFSHSLKEAAAGARWLLAIQQRGWQSACSSSNWPTVTNTAVADAARRYQKEIEFGIAQYERYPANFFARKTALRNLRVIASRSMRDEVDQFTELLVTGAGLNVGNPILVLRERLQRDARVAGTGRTRRIPLGDDHGLIFRAWNASQRGQSLRQIVLPNKKIPVPIGFSDWDFDSAAIGDETEES